VAGASYPPPVAFDPLAAGRGPLSENIGQGPPAYRVKLRRPAANERDPPRMAPRLRDGGLCHVSDE